MCTPTPGDDEMTNNKLLVRLSTLRQTIANDTTLSHYGVVTVDAAIHRLTHTPPRADPVEIRLAIAVDRHGRAGHTSCRPGTVSDEDLMESAESEISGPPSARAFVTLHIPRCEIPTVVGTVESVEATS
jgi:hypothetical protein